MYEYENTSTWTAMRTMHTSSIYSSNAQGREKTVHSFALEETNTSADSGTRYPHRRYFASGTQLPLAPHERTANDTQPLLTHITQTWEGKRKRIEKRAYDSSDCNITYLSHRRRSVLASGLPVLNIKICIDLAIIALCYCVSLFSSRSTKVSRDVRHSFTGSSPCRGIAESVNTCGEKTFEKLREIQDWSCDNSE